MITYVMMAVILITAPVVLVFTLRGVNRMSRATRNAIRAAYVMKATGIFIVFLAMLDYIGAAAGPAIVEFLTPYLPFMGDVRWNEEPFAWPWLLLLGVGLLFAGMTLLQLTSHRTCHCPECPIRQAMQRIDAEGSL